MLTLTLDQYQWLVLQERQRLASGLAEAVPTCWPALAQQLGPRVPAFVHAALQQAWQYGFQSHQHAARLLNLWCIWGPSFEGKPGFEWAAEVLQDPKRRPGIKVQQLIMQTRARLKLAGASVSEADLDRADGLMVAASRRPSVAGWIRQDADEAEPHLACDLKAFEMALGDQSWRREYRLQRGVDGEPVALWSVYEPPRQVYRIDRPQPHALEVAALACAASEGVRALLHLRCEVEAVCDAHLHPRIELHHATGMEVFAGERQLRWPLHHERRAHIPPLPDGGGLACKPDALQLDVLAETCGLRAAGAPMHRQEARLAIWPATQWLSMLRNPPQPEMRWPDASSPTVGTPPVLTLQCDDQPVPVPAWQKDWERLESALREGLSRWGRSLQRDQLLDNVRMRVMPGLMHGQSLWTWGARERVTAEGSVGFLRVQAEGGLVACSTDLTVSGDLVHEGAVGRVRLRSTGEARLDTRESLEDPDADLAQALAQVKVSWRHPFEAELDALSMPALKTLSLEASQPIGALCGEAGLRPRPDGRGYQWYCQITLEPMNLTYVLRDPLTGLQRCTREIWPATTLLDWSAG